MCSTAHAGGRDMPELSLNAHKGSSYSSVSTSASSCCSAAALLSSRNLLLAMRGMLESALLDDLTSSRSFTSSFSRASS